MRSPSRSQSESDDSRTCTLYGELTGGDPPVSLVISINRVISDSLGSVRDVSFTTVALVPWVLQYSARNRRFRKFSSRFGVLDLAARSVYAFLILFQRLFLLRAATGT